MLARRAALERVGPLDRRFFLYFEDVDWCFRMWQAGWEVLYFPGARFTHRHRRQSAQGGALRRGFWLHLSSLISFYEKWGLLVYLLKRWRGPVGVALQWGIDMAALGGALARRLRAARGRESAVPRAAVPPARLRPALPFLRADRDGHLPAARPLPRPRRPRPGRRGEARAGDRHRRPAAAGQHLPEPPADLQPGRPAAVRAAVGRGAGDRRRARSPPRAGASSAAGCRWSGRCSWARRPRSGPGSTATATGARSASIRSAISPRRRRTPRPGRWPPGRSRGSARRSRCRTSSSATASRRWCSGTGRGTMRAARGSPGRAAPPPHPPALAGGGGVAARGRRPRGAVRRQRQRGPGSADRRPAGRPAPAVRPTRRTWASGPGCHIVERVVRFTGPPERLPGRVGRRLPK